MIVRRITLFALALLTAASWAVSSSAQHKQRMGVPPATLTFPEGKDVVEIPFEFERDKILIPVRVNGSEPISFILDTGAPIAVLLGSEFLESLDVNIIGEVQIAGAGGDDPVSTPVAGDVTFDISGIQITKGTMAMGVGEGKLAHFGTKGVIGLPVFKNCVVEFDFQKHILRLHRPEAYTYKGRGKELPLRFSNHGSFPYVTAEVSVDGGAPVPASMVIDTGAGLALSLDVDSDDDLRMPDKTVSSIMGWGASGVIRGRAGRITSLSLGDYVLENVIANFPDAGDMHAIKSADAPDDVVRNGLLGAKVLKRFHVVFDYTNARIILEPNSDFSDPFTFNTTGVVPLPWAHHAESLEVADVINGSPAKLAGIEIGDRITAIDGQPVAAIGVDAIRNALEQEPGTSVTFTIRRGDEELEKKLVRGDLI
jgi:hypothetical protein